MGSILSASKSVVYVQTTIQIHRDQYTEMTLSLITVNYFVLMSVYHMHCSNLALYFLQQLTLIVFVLTRLSVAKSEWAG